MLCDGNRTLKPSVRGDVFEDLLRRAAAESMVLLKNDRKALPFGKDVGTLAVIGPNAAETVIMGGGSSRVNAKQTTSILEAVRARLPTVKVRGFQSFVRSFQSSSNSWKVAGWSGGSFEKARCFYG